MDLEPVMDQVAARLRTIPALAGARTSEYPPDAVSPPAAIVSYPDRIDYDQTYRRGMDLIRGLPVIVVVGKTTDRATRKQVTGYVKGSGVSSVKEVLESGTYTAFDSLTVTGVDFDVVSIGGTDYLAAIFDLDIAGSGA